MPFPEFWEWLQSRPLSENIGFTAWFPFLESIHVLAVGLVVGSIWTVDLRLIGVGALAYPASRIVRELIPWTWGAFVVATITGTGMFLTRASVYIENSAFQMKLLLLVLACANMALFHFRTFRGVAAWDRTTTPRAARLAGTASLAIWAGVILAGRWVGHSI